MSHTTPKRRICKINPAKERFKGIVESMGSDNVIIRETSKVDRKVT